MPLRLTSRSSPGLCERIGLAARGTRKASYDNTKYAANTAAVSSINGCSSSNCRAISLIAV